ncbi:ATP-dependent helicase HrpB [Aestuariivirga litoralis]|uniref:ATP-dependent helicase HrpB n=1 Tax=Aestuariivirga litoralis TaxID=2650924 RepID=A0A2W2AU22_9HYPH|nr:ATP-dependent helicase HrpB [Aestuariivirga litoralis]PZF78731.1 ATP-dependent helicase HrpB [Aestuariivirga litoralis]
MDFPVDQIIPQLSDALARGPAALLVAEPGAGKTTRVPLKLVDAPWLKGQKIVMLEPRRLAARNAAHRMAETLGEAVGETVGYTVRLERRVSAKTRIEVVTEGILTRRLQQDPELAGTGLVIFDEFHERSLDADLGLALTLDIQRGLRDDLKILVMSATLDAARVAAHLGNAPVIDAPGRVFPVETRHLDKAQRQTISADAVRAVHRALDETDKSILVFLPGEAEIRRTEEALNTSGLPRNTVVRPLYGAMSFAEQDAAIRPSPPGERKVVLATTIAETSLTIDGIGAVIDCGFKRVPRFDPASGMTALETVRVSMASADQRRGRAGRLGPGIGYRLWPEAESRALKPHDEPEIFVADLAPLVLELAAWGVTDPKSLPWLDPPPAAPFAQAQDLLRRLEALDHDNKITAMGKQMVRLPLHPRLAHMVVKGNSALAADLAAMLSERDGLPRDAGVDITSRLSHLRGGARDRIRQSAKQIRQIAGIKDEESDVSAGVLISYAFPDRIAQRRGGDRRYRLSGGGGAVLPEHDALVTQDFLAVATTDGASGDQKIFLAAPLSLKEIEEHFRDQIEARDGVFWDSRTKAVSASKSRRLGQLVLEEKPSANADPTLIAEAMTEGVRDMGLAALPWTDGARILRARAMFLRRLYPEEGWPDLSDEALLASLADWLTPYLAGISRRAHLDRLDMHQIIQSLIPHELARKLDRLAPVRIEVPSGADVRIDYETEGDPVLRVRLQEMFGLARTPAIAEGRSPLRIELLSPAGRPLAVTQSLETFWTNGYPSVRSDMRGRYPKHAWPEDPLNAAPVKPRRLR